MSEVIVVGIDGSETASRAAESARDLALALGTALHIVMAYEDEGAVVFGTGSDQSFASHEAKAETVAYQAAQRLASTGLEIGYSAVRGKAAHALLNQAHERDARMIVVGNKGPSRIRPRLRLCR